MLTSDTLQNLQNQNKVWETSLPQGAARNLHNSSEFMSILEEGTTKANTGAAKKTNKTIVVNKPIPVRE